jgi:hypothetical protein
LTATQSKRRTQRLYDPLGWAVVRAPLLPAEAYLELADPPSGGRAWWGANLDTPTSRDPQVRLALLVGAGHLAKALQEGTGRDRKASGKLLRYLIRMSTRPTPYGLFAGVGLGTFGATTNLKLSDAAAPRRARPDMAWLLSLIGTLEARPALLRQLNVRTHPALFAAAGRVRLGDPTPLADSPQTGPVSVRASDALMAVLLLANSCIPYTRLVEELSGLIGATTERTDTFLTELWRQGLLLSNLRPPLTSTSPATHLVERLLCIADPPPEAPRLKAALDALSNWNRLNIAEAASEWPAWRACSSRSN